MKTLSVVCVALIIGVAAHAQRLAVGVHAEPPPGELADPLEALMATGGQRVHVGQTTFDFWWVKTLPLTTESRGVAWAALAEGTLVGAVTLSAPYPDDRGRMVPAGIYTLRNVSEPQTADRSRLTPPATLLLLAPVADDDKTDPIGHDDAVALASRTPGSSNPPAWWVDTSAAPAGSTQTAGGGPTTVNVTLPASREGMDVGTLTFGLVLVGTIQPH
ncbi:MAG TPA: hypothetical protein VG222_19745 [Vicinamibacterales bacterium]|nr:hypothetical protein [Vicinamibacterales bacterium]